MTTPEVPFLAKAIQAHKSKVRTDLSFKKGQDVTVERVDQENDLYYGFYGKKEGWFPNYYVLPVEGGKPEARKKTKTRGATLTPGKEDGEEEGVNLVASDGAGDTGAVSKKELKKQQQAAKLAAKKDKKEQKRKQKKDKKVKGGGRRGSNGANENHTLEEGVPAIVEQTVAYLETPERLKLEGLFRVSGSQNDVKRLKGDYLAGKKVDLTKVMDPHTVAGVLKIFFRESPAPLLTFELYDCWIAAVATPQGGNVARSIQQVLALLPSTNKKILERLMGLLHKIIQHADVNLMNVNNLAIVFAPTLLRPPGDQIDIAIQDSSHANNLIKYMIEQYETIFATQSADDANAEGDAAKAKPGEQQEEFMKKIRRGSLLMAKGSMIGGHNTFTEMINNNDEDSNVEIDLSYNDIGGEGSESESTAGEEEEEEVSEEESSSGSDAHESGGGGVKLSMEEMMDKILEGHVNEVDDYLSTLDPPVAARTKKELLERIDALMNSEEFRDD
ncbi:Myosin IX [Balamuthia mandrillaris]